MKRQIANLSITFPVTLSGQWQSPNDESLSQLPKNLRNWLLDEGSLTARLKRQCKHFEVMVIGEEQQLCSKQDSSYLINIGEPIIVREVLLYCDDVPQIFARSILPLKTLTGKEEALGQLGDQPLGQVLFNNPSLQRQRLELSSFSTHSSVALLAENLDKASLVSDGSGKRDRNLWGRRSIFIIEDKPLMVSEVFLPRSFAYQSEREYRVT